MRAARNNNIFTTPSHTQALVSVATIAACSAAIPQPCRAPTCFIPMPKNKFPAELKTTRRTSKVDVLKLEVLDGVMKMRAWGTARGWVDLFALLLLVLSDLRIARLGTYCQTC